MLSSRSQHSPPPGAWCRHAHSLSCTPRTSWELPGRGSALGTVVRGADSQLGRLVAGTRHQPDLSGATLGIGTSDTFSTGQITDSFSLFTIHLLSTRKGKKHLFGLIWKDLGHLNPWDLEIHKTALPLETVPPREVSPREIGHCAAVAFPSYHLSLQTLGY